MELNFCFTCFKGKLRTEGKYSLTGMLKKQVFCLLLIGLLKLLDNLARLSLTELVCIFFSVIEKWMRRSRGYFTDLPFHKGTEQMFLVNQFSCVTQRHCHLFRVPQSYLKPNSLSSCKLYSEYFPVSTFITHPMSARNSWSLFCPCTDQSLKLAEV